MAPRAQVACIKSSCHLLGGPRVGARATARAQPHGRRNVMRGSGLIWTIVGVLLIIALLIYIF